ncbi:very-long-chain (3R)-3-hydroxyacyl-CoA dehydratase 2 [Athalia rosae]|uniref:very-long-chain (3R)-3-hydroxyacyl-CoA dehydratase 2 n=1 Tax=Athalia rosae TaxID=37344 RepID=UPI0020334F45|nr:very-long-chain (3R)-3-hydroxyacyl-CoA dehydratase 2 [Athalia rosae]XP_012264952.2 very-long-chain (3R)-3-hydroxyacyl-CoA dehydratase 2 [Athalia rosae]
MAGKGSKNKEPGIIGKSYLIAYNLGQVLGWTYLLYQIQGYYLGLAGNKSLWNTVGTTVVLFQNAAVLEIFNAVTGLVPSNPLITIFQVFSRVMVVCGVILATPLEYAAASPGLPLALTAWSFAEIIRYLYYFLNLTGQVPYLVVWLRYTGFIALYPIGVTGELLCFYAAQQYAQVNSDAWSYTLPNAWNFTFNYNSLLIGVMLLYIPLFPQMYLHMFAQRRKILGSVQATSKKTH